MTGHEHHHHHHQINNMNRTLFVIIVTIITMITEVVYGLLTNSMALLSDGWHMGTHAFALGITFVAYLVINKIQAKEHEHAHVISQKISSLAGYTSSLFLLITAFWIIFESIARFFAPLKISFNDALLIAGIGFVVNVICIFIMEFGNEKSDDDYNYKAAYFHILTDAMTSIFAIIALLTGKYFGWVFLDPTIGILSGLLILKWSVQLVKETSKILLDLKLIEK